MKHAGFSDVEYGSMSETHSTQGINSFMALRNSSRFVVRLRKPYSISLKLGCRMSYLP
ncbi:MAG: hypothetical protein LBD42_09005 [Desulfovibrio sp.]|jgi:hypothetical protein|nr:hypothetical protein [Desulfovibrio sp.]